MQPFSFGHRLKKALNTTFLTKKQRNNEEQFRFINHFLGFPEEGVAKRIAYFVLFGWLLTPAKNVLKLCTEFLLNVAIQAMTHAKMTLGKNRSSVGALEVAIISVFSVFIFFLKAIRFFVCTITSPLEHAKKYLEKASLAKSRKTALFLAGLSIGISIGAYAALLIFGSPVIALVGAKVGLTATFNAIASSVIASKIAYPFVWVLGKIGASIGSSLLATTPTLIGAVIFTLGSTAAAIINGAREAFSASKGKAPFVAKQNKANNQNQENDPLLKKTLSDSNSETLINTNTQKKNNLNQSSDSVILNHSSNQIPNNPHNSTTPSIPNNDTQEQSDLNQSTGSVILNHSFHQIPNNPPNSTTSSIPNNDRQTLSQNNQAFSNLPNLYNTERNLNRSTDSLISTDSVRKSSEKDQQNLENNNDFNNNQTSINTRGQSNFRKSQSFDALPVSLKWVKGKMPGNSTETGKVPENSTETSNNKQKNNNNPPKIPPHSSNETDSQPSVVSETNDHLEKSEEKKNPSVVNTIGSLFGGTIKQVQSNNGTNTSTQQKTNTFKKTN